MSKYSVKLNQGQRKLLEDLVKKGEAPARKIAHANILLKTDSGEQGPRWSLKKIHEKQMKVNWRFTTEDARIKLKRLYPSFEECASPPEETK